MSEHFRVVERNDMFFVTDVGGHALATCPDEESARQEVKKLEAVVRQNQLAARSAEKDNPRSQR